MRRMILPCLMVAWLVCPRIAAAQEPDPIKRALDQARSDHGRRRDAAKVKLSQDIEATIKAAADKSDLPGLKQLEAQKEAFDRDGQLPTGAMVAKARLTYEDEIRAARVDLRKALEKAKTEYTKARKVALAEAIDGELRDTAPKVERKKIKEPPPSDPITGQWQIAIGERQFEGDRVRNLNIRLDPGGVGSMQGLIWRKVGEGHYSITLPRGGTGKVRLGPKGEQFDGRMADGKRIHGSRKI